MLLTAATRVRFRSRLFVRACERACVSGIIQIYGRISDILLFVRTSQRLAPRNKISAAWQCRKCPTLLFFKFDSLNKRSAAATVPVYQDAEFGTLEYYTANRWRHGEFKLTLSRDGKELSLPSLLQICRTDKNSDDRVQYGFYRMKWFSSSLRVLHIFQHTSFCFGSLLSKAVRFVRFVFSSVAISNIK